MCWLSPPKPDNEYHGMRIKRVDHVAGWLLETSKFRGWWEGGTGAFKAVSFCSRNPGVGKTYLR